MRRHRIGSRSSWAAATLTVLAASLVAVSATGQRPSGAAVSPGVTERVSVLPNGSEASFGGQRPSISADGQHVVFESETPMVAPDANERGGEFGGDQTDIYLRDRRDADTTVLISAGLQQPSLSCSPDPLTLTVGAPTGTVTCTAEGGSVEVTEVLTTGSAAFDLATPSAGDCAPGVVLAVGEPCTVGVTFDPQPTGADEVGGLQVRFHGGVGTVELQGENPTPGTLACTPSPLNIILIDPAVAGSRMLTCTASGGDGGAGVVINSATFEPLNTTIFNVQSDTCRPSGTDRTLADGESCQYQINYFRFENGTDTTTFSVINSGTPEAVAVVINGSRIPDPGPGIRQSGPITALDAPDGLRAGSLHGKVGRAAAAGSVARPAQPVPPAQEANGASHEPVISADGRFVAFSSSATNLVPNQGPLDPHGADSDVFLHDRDADDDGIFDEPGATSTIIVSRLDAGSQGSGTSPSISADGQRVAYVDSIPPGGGEPSGDDGSRVVYFDRTTSVVTPVSVVTDLDFDGVEDTVLGSDSPSISADGNHVAFRIEYQEASVTRQALGVRDLRQGPAATQRIDAHVVGGAVTGLDGATAPAISGNGRIVAFVVPYGPGNVPQVIAVDRDIDGDGSFGPFDPARSAEWFQIISSNPDGTPGAGLSRQPAITADGRYVAFATSADLAGGSSPGQCEGPDTTEPLPRCQVVVVRDRLAPPGSPLELISVAIPPTSPLGWDVHDPAVSSDGRFVGYTSRADNLVPVDDNTEADAFLRELTPDLVCTPDPAELGLAQIGSTSPPRTITCTNTTFGPLAVLSATRSGEQAAQFSIAVDTCTGTVLHQGGSCFVAVRAAPTAAGPLGTTLRVMHDGGVDRGVEQAAVRLRAIGTEDPVVPPAGLGTNPDSIDFGERLLLSTTGRGVTITNTGSGAHLDITALSIHASGAIDASADYRISSEDCTAAALAPGDTCRVNLEFRPLPRDPDEGPRPAVLVIASSAPGTPHLVTLTGRTPLPQVIVNPGVGRGGSVALVIGTNFPADEDAVIAFEGYPELVPGRTDSNGEVRVPLLVLPRSTIGPRIVTVTAGGVSATYPFLVEPGSIQIGSELFLIRR